MSVLMLSSYAGRADAAWNAYLVTIDELHDVIAKPGATTTEIAEARKVADHAHVAFSIAFSALVERREAA